jgi:hypothetical protein
LDFHPTWTSWHLAAFRDTLRGCGHLRAPVWAPQRFGERLLRSGSPGGQGVHLDPDPSRQGLVRGSCVSTTRWKRSSTRAGRSVISSSSSGTRRFLRVTGTGKASAPAWRRAVFIVARLAKPGCITKFISKADNAETPGGTRSLNLPIRGYLIGVRGCPQASTGIHCRLLPTWLPRPLAIPRRRALGKLTPFPKAVRRATRPRRLHRDRQPPGRIASHHKRFGVAGAIFYALNGTRRHGSGSRPP